MGKLIDLPAWYEMQIPYQLGLYRIKTTSHWLRGQIVGQMAE